MSVVKRVEDEQHYQGVVARRGAFEAVFEVGGKRHRGGQWATAKEAAIARDRLVLGLNLDVPLHFPRQSRARGPASAAELLRESRALRKTDRGKSRYVGVYRPPESTSWRVRTGTRGEYVGGFESEEEAAVAYDRVARHRGVPPSHWNFPERKLKSCSPEELESAMAKRHRAQRGLVGIYPTRNGRFLAQVNVQGRAVSAGAWATEREAALARDRAALFAGYDPSQLNLPDQALSAGPLAPEALQREARLSRRTKRFTSRYLGVQWEQGLGKWRAFITRDATYVPIGAFADEEEAAEARDRVWLHMGGDPQLVNFPDRELEPASLEAMREEVRRAFKENTSSQYTGVCLNRQTGEWMANITVDGQHHRLGNFKNEVDAAKAYDEAAKRLGAKRAKLNFP
jgi:hypothetical protein